MRFVRLRKADEDQPRDIVARFPELRGEIGRKGKEDGESGDKGGQK